MPSEEPPAPSQAGWRARTSSWSGAFIDRRAWAAEAPASQRARRGLILTLGAIAVCWMATSVLAGPLHLTWLWPEHISEQGPLAYAVRVVAATVAGCVAGVALLAGLRPARLGLVAPSPADPAAPVDGVEHRSTGDDADHRDEPGDPPLPRFDTLRTLG